MQIYPTAYSPVKLANYIYYLESHNEEDMYRKDDDLNVRLEELNNLEV